MKYFSILIRLSTVASLIIHSNLHTIMSSTTVTDYHKVLSVERNANTTQIKKDYHSLALEHHPDKNPDSDGARFKSIFEAYEVLSDPIKKFEYDKSHVPKDIPPPKTSRSDWADWDRHYADMWNLRQPTATARENGNTGRYYRQTHYDDSFSQRNYYPRSRSVSPDRVSKCSSNNSETRAASKNPETRRGYGSRPDIDPESGFRFQERPFRGVGGPSRTMPASRTLKPSVQEPSTQEPPPSRSRAVPSGNVFFPSRTRAAPSRSQQTSSGRREQTQRDSHGLEVDFIPEWGIEDILESPT